MRASVSENAEGGATRSAPEGPPSPDEARDWLKKHLASRPDRDQAWYDRVMSIYAADRPVAKPAGSR